MAMRAAAVSAGMSAMQASTATPVAGQVSLNAVTYPSLTFPIVAMPSPTTTITPTGTVTPTSTPVNAAGSVNVYVGYADSLRSNPNLPVPWQGSPNTIFVGGADGSNAYDSGAIRLDNTTASTVTVKDVSVVLHTVNNDGTGGPASGQTFDLWGAHSIAPNGSLILAATGPGDNFDTSDFPLPGTSCTSPAGATTNPPHIMLTFADNSQATVTDTAHVLDTGGYDTANCPSGNESLQWRALGTTGVSQAAGHLALATPTATQIAGVGYAEVASLTDASNQPQPNVAVNFSVTSGPNAGLTGQAVTDGQGHAAFTYTSTVAGTDTIAASITNASGGVVSANPVTVTWAPTPVADLSLRAIATGLDVRLVLQNATSAGPFTLALAQAPGVQTFQDASGVVRVTQPVTRYDDSGSPYVITPTEYLAQVPIATDSGADPAAPVNTGPATTSVVLTTANNTYLALNVDPTWLHDPHRVFPVTVDLPIATGSAYVDSGLVGSVNSCAPTAAAPPTDLVVGVENGCTYNGQGYFDLSSVPYDAPIASATLRLYTPSQTGTTGVQLYQNAPPATGSDPAQPPSWSSAPAVVTSTAPIAQGGSTGHWQSWDVTGLVKQWVRDGASNGGVTLQSAGTPVRFAGSLGTASADPSLAPYLDITYGTGVSGMSGMTMNAATTANATPGPFNDGAQTIYGESGSYTIHGEAGMSQCSSAPHPDVTCPSIITGQYYGNLEPKAVKNKLGGQYIRFNVQLACPSYSQYGISTYAPGRVWWNTNFDNPLKDSNGKIVLDSGGHPIVSALNNEGDAGSIIVAAVKYDNEIPIIELTPNGGCPSDMKPLLWYKQAQDFVQYLYALIGTSRMVYFEIGNEPNGSSFRGYTDGQEYDGVDALDAKPGQKADGAYHYPDVFAAATHGIQSAVAQGSPYRILTGGMAAPTADRTRDIGCSGAYFTSNVVVAGNAIRAAGQLFNAQKAQAYGIPAGPIVVSANLGVAVHPYGYDTPGGRYWKNYHTTFNAYDPADPNQQKRHLNAPSPKSTCERLDFMLSTWRNTRNIPGNIPVIFTETNWSSDHYPATPAEGTYLADLFTWMYDHDYLYHTRTPSNSPLRVLVFRGSDAPGDNLGIYKNDGSDKPADATSNTGAAIPLPACRTSAIKPGVSYSIAHNYYWLRYAACYP